MNWIDRLAELWDRRRILCWSIAAACLAIGIVAQRWLPDGFGAEVFQTTSKIPIVGPPEWNARLRFIAREKEQYLGAVPDNADEGELNEPDRAHHTSFSGGQASLRSRTFGGVGGRVTVDAGTSPILILSEKIAVGSVDEKIAAGAEDGSVRIWDIPSPHYGAEPKALATLHAGPPVTALAFGDKGTILASGGSDGTIRIWDLSGKPRLRATIRDQKRTVYALAFSEDGSELSSGGFDGVLRVWRWESNGPAVVKARRNGPIYAIEPTGKWDVGYDGGPSAFPALPNFPTYAFPNFFHDDWAGNPGLFRLRDRIYLSPNRRFAAILTGLHPMSYLTVWEQGHFTYPYGLRYRGYVPNDFLGDEVLWSRDSTALCFYSQNHPTCQWLDARTGRPAGPSVNNVVAGSPLKRAQLWGVGPADRTMVDRLTGRTSSAAIADDGSYFLRIGYVGRRFPLVPIELLILPLAVGALALLIWRSPYWTRKRSFAPALATVRAFFAAAGTEISESRLGLLRLSRLDPPLTPYAPVPAVIAIGPADESHIERLVERMKSLHGENHRAAGFLLYLESPNAVALLRMAEARIKQLAVIPIPLASLEGVKDSPAEARALLTEYANRYLPGRNLFDDRDAISDAVAFFGRGRLLAKLEQELLNYQSLGLWGLRKAGKTSILLQLEQILRNNAVVRIGLEPFTARSPFGNRIFNEVLRQLSVRLRRLGKEVACPEFPVNAPARDSTVAFLAVAQEFAGRLTATRTPPPIVCMLDEMERVLPKDAASTEEFNVTFGALRNLCQHARVMSLLVTDLFPDSSQINQWPVAGAGTNPLFDFLKSVYAGPFEQADTFQMIGSLGKLMNFPLDQAELTAIQALSGGHPFLARQVAAMLYERREDGPGRGRLLSNPIRFSDTLRSYFPENIWRPLEARHDTAALSILTLLADGDAWIACSELQARSGLSKTAFWSAVEWLAEAGVIARQTMDGEESCRVSIGMFAQWFQQSEVSVRKYA